MHEDLIKALRHCVLQNPCDGCPFYSGMDKQTEQCASINLLAADAIEELTGFVQEVERDRDEYRERLDKANDTIEEMSRRCEQFQYMPPPAWIPVGERLPKADEEVLIYLWNNSRAYIAWVGQEGQWETNDFYVDKDYLPKAWLPLPKPYEPPKEEPT